MKRNILIDLRALQSGKISGVEVFTVNLVRELCTKMPETHFFLWTNSKALLPKNFPEFPFPNAERLHTEFSNIFLALRSALFRAPKIDLLLTKVLREKNLLQENDSLEIILVPDPRPTPISPQCKKIIIFHDLSPFYFPQSFSLKSQLWHKLVRFKTEAREAAHLLTPSRATKADLERSFGIPNEKISVIGAGVSGGLRQISDAIELEAVRQKYQLPDTFFLTLSTLEPRKNLARLIEAFQRLRQKTKNSALTLVIAGSKNTDVFAESSLSHSSGVIFLGHIVEVDKAALYSAATAFVYPSLFEGFGLPVLEAMACGTPMLCSNAAALPEVYGDAALSFNPRSVSEITDALETILTRRELQEELRQKGLARAQSPQFSWETVAEKTKEVLLRS